MGMVGISKGIITKLFEAGLVSNISDLYKIKVENLLCVPGFKDKSANNIVNEIQKASCNVKLSRWLGALPLKDISAKTWQMIIDAGFNYDEMKASNVYRYQISTGNIDTFMEACVPLYVHGVGERTYAMIKESMATYWEDIKETIKYISFDCNTLVKNIPSKGRVTLTGFRDSELISLLTLRGYDVNDFSSKTMALVIPYSGYVSSKVSKANRMGIPIYLPEEAKEALK
jgi:NAD-dependent DNA ligase